MPSIIHPGSLVYIKNQGRLQSKLSQLLLITLDRSFQMEYIAVFQRGLRGERSQIYPYTLSANERWLM